MRKYLISFDLNNKLDRTNDYKKIDDLLYGLGSVCKPLSNVYLLASDDVVSSEIRNKLMDFLSVYDKVIVLKLEGPYASFNFRQINSEISEIMKK